MANIFMNGLLPEGKFTRENNRITGTYKGYYITFYLKEVMCHLTINGYKEEDVGNVALKDLVDKLSNEYKEIQSVQNKKYSISFIIKKPRFKSSLPAIINPIVNKLIAFMEDNNYSTGCGNCGEAEGRSDFYEINGDNHYLCEKCSRDIEGAFINNQDNIAAKKSRFLPGLIGSIVGALIGGVIWVLIYNLGYIAGIAGAAIVILALKGYELLGGELDKKGLIASLVVSVITIYLANRIAWTWSAYVELKEYYIVTFMEVYGALDELIMESDLTMSYYVDLLIGYLLTLLCSIRPIISEFKRSTGSYTMRRI